MREAYDAATAVLLAAARVPERDGAALAEAMREVSGQPGEIVLPGQLRKEHWSADAAVDFEGAATWLDWSGDGEPSNVWVRVWRPAAGGIEDFAVLSAGEGGGAEETIACLGAVGAFWVVLLGTAMETVIDTSQAIALTFLELAAGVDPIADSAWRERAIAAADAAETAGRELGALASSPPPGELETIARESRTAGESFAEAAALIRSALDADSAEALASRGEGAQAASATGMAAMERAVEALAALCGE